MANDEIAWLIERADPHHPGCVLGGNFLGVVGSYDGVTGNGNLRWVERADDALRFARQKDAAKFIGAIELIMDGLPHAATLAGLRSGDIRAMPIEHMWTD